TTNQTGATTMIKTKALLLAGAIALANVTPAAAHGGWNWGSFAAGAAIGLLAPPVYAPPYYAYPPLYYGPPAPPAWYYPPRAPAPWPPYAAQPAPVIRHVQAGLNAIGFGPLNVDGIEGFETYNAICAFQAGNGLVVDGVAGSGTLAVLDARLAAIAPPPPPP